MMGNLKQIFVSFACLRNGGHLVDEKMEKVGVGAASVMDMGAFMPVENSILAAGAVNPVFFCFMKPPLVQQAANFFPGCQCLQRR